MSQPAPTTVYVVLSGLDCEGGWVYGVFASQEEAVTQAPKRVTPDFGKTWKFAGHGKDGLPYWQSEPGNLNWLEVRAFTVTQSATIPDSEAPTAPEATPTDTGEVAKIVSWLRTMAEARGDTRLLFTFLANEIEEGSHNNPLPPDFPRENAGPPEGVRKHVQAKMAPFYTSSNGSRNNP